MSQIKLSVRELSLAAHHGIQRWTRSQEDGSKGKNNQPKHGPEQDIMGATGELAVSRYTGLYWSGVAAIGAPDVGGFIDVRTVTDEDHRLIIQKDEKPESIQVLVLANTEDTSIFVIMGWIYAHEGMVDRWWTEPVKGRGAFFVATDALHPPVELFPLIAEHMKNRCDAMAEWAKKRGAQA